MTRFKHRMAAVLRLSDYRKQSVPLDFSSRTYSLAVQQRRDAANVTTTAADAGKLKRRAAVR
jgi:hypothetical protein